MLEQLDAMVELIKKIAKFLTWSAIWIIVLYIVGFFDGMSEFLSRVGMG